MMKKKSRQPHSRFVMGKNSVKEILHNSPDRIIQVFTAKKQDPLIDEIQKAGIPLREISKDSLTDKVQSESHQSFVAEIKERTFLDIDSYLEKEENRLVLMLDSIFDPQNFGALLRAAECFGADAVVWSKNRGTDITPVVSKASVGASELLSLIKVSNLAETVKKFKNAGFWIVTAEIGENAESLYSFDFPEKTLLIMGSEGKGVQPLLSKLTDFKVYIPMSGKIDSLNVSQAASVILSHWKLQKNRA